MFWWIFLAGFISKPVSRFLVPPNYTVSVSNAYIGNTGESSKNNNTDASNLKKETLFNSSILNENKQKRWFKGSNYTYGDGEDKRQVKNSTEEDDFVLLNITRFISQMNLLTILESNRVSVNEKISAIKKYEKNNNDDGYIVKLKAGGLFKDWDNSSQSYF